MLSSQRKQQILALLEEDKQVLSRELSARFAISEDSIRRDLRELAAEGLLQRVHGGALPASRAIAPLETRKSVQISSKKRVAQKAVALIQSGQVVMVDGGTTTSEMMKMLPQNMALTIVTHSPGIAVMLADYPLIEVILIGGKLYKHSMVTVGASMMENIQRFNADLFFMGVTGVHKSAGLTTGDYEEACVKRALAGRAAETVVLVSLEKLNSASAFAIGELSLASTVVLDGEPDAEMQQLFHEQQISVL